MWDYILPFITIKIENFQHFPELHQPTDLPTVPSRVTQRFLPQTHNSSCKNMSQLNQDIRLTFHFPIYNNSNQDPSAFKFVSKICAKLFMIYFLCCFFVARPTRLLSSLPLFRPTGRPGLIGDAEQAEQVCNLKSVRFLFKN